MSSCLSIVACYDKLHVFPSIERTAVISYNGLRDFILVVKLRPLFYLLMILIIPFQTYENVNVGYGVIIITCDTNKSPIAFKCTYIFYFKGVGYEYWVHVVCFILCGCVCTIPIHGWQSRDSVFFHCASCSLHTLSILFQVCHACWSPSNQSISTLPQNNQQPIKASAPLAAVQASVVLPKRFLSIHHINDASQRSTRLWGDWHVEYKIKTIPSLINAF